MDYKKGFQRELGRVSRLRGQLATAQTEIGRKDNVIANIQLQAQSWAGEAKTMQSIVSEVNQICSNATGEKGNWNGANPVRELKAEIERLRERNDKLTDLVQCLIDNEPDEPIADGGHVVLDLWRYDARLALAPKGERDDR